MELESRDGFSDWDWDMVGMAIGVVSRKDV